MRFLSRIAAVALLAVPALATGACAKLHARALGPALETPMPPPRVVPSATQPIESQPIVASPPVGDVPAASPERIPERPVAAKPQETAPPPAAPAAPAVATTRPEVSEPPPTLQTTANPAAAEQRTRAALANATRDLGRIDIRAMNPDAKAQYDIARRFIAQATDALNGKNFEFAQQLADKAATLAALLQKR